MEACKFGHEKFGKWHPKIGVFRRHEGPSWMLDCRCSKKMSIKRALKLDEGRSERSENLRFFLHGQAPRRDLRAKFPVEQAMNVTVYLNMFHVVETMPKVRLHGVCSPALPYTLLPTLLVRTMAFPKIDIGFLNLHQLLLLRQLY